ncbi:MAG: EamA family transporter [Actinomycetota bacterium]|nr:EamA family transporter [Actinomycetota bacterium]
MIAILGGLGAALMWGTATLCSSRSSRMLGAGTVLSWVMLTGLAIALPAALATGVPDGLDRGVGEWLLLSGAMNVAGLALVYEALRIGKVGIVSPLASTEGAIAALLAVLAGEALGIPTALLLILIALGIVLAAHPAEEHQVDHLQPGKATLMAIGAAATFGVGLYASGRVSDLLPVAWVILPARVLGTVFVALPIAVRGKLRLTREAAPLVAVAGLCEITGMASYAIGARHGIAVAAVLASQFAAVAAIGAYVMFHERLSRVQRTGAIVILVGVAFLTAINA